MPDISVIIPIYNVENYLGKCIDSVLNQTFKSYEIILIDDDSPDKCPQIADDYQKKYPDIIKVLHKENGGQGECRNIGANMATGDYILFLDSDDYIDNDMLEVLYSAAVSAIPQADIVLCGYKTVDETGRVLAYYYENLPENTEMKFKDYKNIMFVSAAPWNRLVKRELLLNSGITFPRKVWYEDIRSTVKWFTKANIIKYVNKPLHNYLIRNNSTMNNKNCGRNAEIIEAFDDIIGYYKSCDLYEEYKEELEYMVIYHILIAASVRVLMINDKSELLKQFKDYANSKFPNWANNKHLDNLDKNKSLILKLIKGNHYRLIKWIFKLKNKLN